MSETRVMSSDPSASKLGEEQPRRSRDVGWYQKDLPPIPQSAREVFESYSDIQPEKVNDHIYQIREKAWDIWPFPCLGAWRFLNLNLCTTPQYPEVLSRLQNGAKLLDLGCCFGQELRRLVFDGAPAANLYGVDLQPEFFELGYELFLDRDGNDMQFIAADIFDQPDALMALKGQISIVYAGSFFHLFDRPGQVQAAKLLTQLFKPESNSILFGRQVGSIHPGLYEHTSDDGVFPKGRMYRHDQQSWKEMWEEVGRETGVSFEVESELKEIQRWKELGLADDGVRQLEFCVRRL